MAQGSGSVGAGAGPARPARPTINIGGQPKEVSHEVKELIDSQGTPLAASEGADTHQITAEKLASLCDGKADALQDELRTLSTAVTDSGSPASF